jgi:hypothetical protein
MRLERIKISAMFKNTALISAVSPLLKLKKNLPLGSEFVPEGGGQVGYILKYIQENLSLLNINELNCELLSTCI